MSNRAVGTKFERLVAKDIEGSIRPGSGCLPGIKGDVINWGFLVECKASNSGRIRIPQEWIGKIKTHAATESRQWALAIKPSMRYTDDYMVMVDPTLLCEELRGSLLPEIIRQKGVSVQMGKAPAGYYRVRLLVFEDMSEVAVVDRRFFMEMSESLLKENDI